VPIRPSSRRLSTPTRYRKCWMLAHSIPRRSARLHGMKLAKCTLERNVGNVNWSVGFMTCSSMILRSSVIGTFALLAPLACERDMAQPAGAENDRTGATVASAGSGAGMRARGDLEGTERGSATGTGADQTGSGAIERTSGRDVPLGTGGSASKLGGGAAGRGGSAGKGGAGGTMARP
jgi:hypothetical protein